MVFLTQVSVHKTDANLGHRASWAEVPRERGARSGVNKKHFGGTAGSRDLQKSNRAFARHGLGRDPSLYTTSTDPPLNGQSGGRGAVPTWTGSAATSGNRAGPFGIFKVVFVGHIQSFGFILSVYDAQAS